MKPFLSREQAEILAREFGARIRDRGAAFDEETMLAFGEAIAKWTVRE